MTFPRKMPDPIPVAPPRASKTTKTKTHNDAIMWGEIATFVIAIVLIAMAW